MAGRALSRYRRRQIRKSMKPGGKRCVLSAIAPWPVANVRLPIHRSTLNEPSDRYPRRLLPFPVV